MIRALWRRLTACSPSWCDPAPPRNRAERRGGGPMLDRAMDAPPSTLPRCLP